MERVPPKAMFTDHKSITSQDTEQQLLDHGPRHERYDRPKGAFKQTIGSTIAAIGELIGNAKMEAKGDKQLKAGLEQEDRGIRRDVGSRLT